MTHQLYWTVELIERETGRVEVIDMRLTEWAARRVAARLEANNKNCYTRVCPPGGKDAVACIL